MAPSTINVLLTSFPGLGLPSTLCLPLPATTSVSDFTTLLSQRIPPRLHDARLILTTNSNKEIPPTSSAPLAAFVEDGGSNILPLRLSHALCGGKGGFGSQLRAAGGRMSSRKKRDQRDNNSSSRNLDGRRLRTVTEAKALAEYLAVKPEMEKREKEERRKRWEQVVEIAERREAEIKSGSKAKVDGKWAEAKEEAEAKMRDAVIAAMKRGDAGPSRLIQKEGDAEEDSETSEDESGESEATGSSSKNTTPPGSEILAKESRKIFGWDDEMSDSDEDEDEEDADAEHTKAISHLQAKSIAVV